MDLFDLYLRENLKTRPDFSLKHPEYKAMTAALYRKYAPAFTGQFHIEPFHIDICYFMETGKLREKNCFILFDYSRRHPVLKQAHFTEIWEDL